MEKRMKTMRRDRLLALIRAGKMEFRLPDGTWEPAETYPITDERAFVVKDGRAYVMSDGSIWLTPGTAGDETYRFKKAAKESAVDPKAGKGVEFADGSVVPLSYVDKMMGMVTAALSSPRKGG